MQERTGTLDRWLKRLPCEKVFVMLAVIGMLSGTVKVAAQQELPTGAAVLDTHVEAAGGKAAFDKINNRMVKGTFEIPAQNVKLSMTVYAEKPNKVYTILESEALGKIERGVTDGVVWEKSLMAGPQIKEGQERIDGLRDATFDRFAYWRTVYDTAECVGVETLDGKPYFKVVLTPKEGGSTTVYFDQETGLMTRIEFEVKGPMGTVPVQASMDDYRRVDGILMAHRVKMKVLTQERLITTQSVQHNVDMPPNLFSLPEDVQKIRDKK